MKKVYVKPVLNASMEGTLEGVYAYGNVMAGCIPCYSEPNEPASRNNPGSVPASTLQPACFNLPKWLYDLIFGSHGSCGGGYGRRGRKHRYDLDDWF